MVDIFQDAKEKVMPEWAKFVKDGDAVQGTYVGKILGQIDGYGNEQIIYQLLQEDGRVVNVGFGLNKKVINQDMDAVCFGQIVGFKYKGKLTVKDKFGKPVEVKDFSIYQDRKIVNQKWLDENKDNMPKVVRVTAQAGEAEAEKQFKEMFSETATSAVTPSVDSHTVPGFGDVPFSSTGSLTNEDKLKEIEKQATAKLGASDALTTKTLVMAKTGVPVIPVNYDKILNALAAL